MRAIRYREGVQGKLWGGGGHWNGGMGEMGLAFCSLQTVTIGGKGTYIMPTDSRFS